MAGADRRGTQRSELVVDDPRMLRALAHEARQRVVYELFNGEALTATEAAGLCDISPSAMSYHLRALEKWGFVRRVDATDGRERPWAAAADSIRIPSGAHRDAQSAATQMMTSMWTRDIAAGLARTEEAVAAGSDSTRVSRGRLWLTPDEQAELDTALDAVLERFRGRSSREHPADAEPYDAYWLLLPSGESADRG
ncbi:helix-turn-helix domain-containing protein [Actinomycetota bacterium]